MEKLKTHDLYWWEAVQNGLEYEILSYKMDIEDPEAAGIITVALTKGNETAMQTGHLEIMKAMQSLCTPDPKTGTVDVPWPPVLDKLKLKYGAKVEHNEILHMFRFIMVSGGANSPHLKRLDDFTTLFVNCLLYTSPSPRDLSTSRMPSSA